MIVMVGDVAFCWAMESMDAVATLQELVRRINAHDPKAIVSLCTGDHVFIDSLGAQMSGRERLEQGWSGYFSLFPDYRIDVEVAAAENELYSLAGSHPPLIRHRKSRGAFQLHGPCERRTDCRVAGVR
jgi:hypothetical protein